MKGRGESTKGWHLNKQGTREHMKSLPYQHGTPTVPKRRPLRPPPALHLLNPWTDRQLARFVLNRNRLPLCLALPLHPPPVHPLPILTNLLATSLCSSLVGIGQNSMLFGLLLYRQVSRSSELTENIYSYIHYVRNCFSRVRLFFKGFSWRLRGGGSSIGSIIGGKHGAWYVGTFLCSFFHQ